jgi:peptidoglycan hydrolase CwlO-like protein
MPNSTLQVLKDGVATSLQAIGRSIVQTHSLDAHIRNPNADSSALHSQMTGLLQELNHLREDLKKVSKGLTDLY